MGGTALFPVRLMLASCAHCLPPSSSEFRPPT